MCNRGTDFLQALPLTPEEKRNRLKKLIILSMACLLVGASILSWHIGYHMGYKDSLKIIKIYP